MAFAGNLLPICYSNFDGILKIFAFDLAALM